MIDPTKPLHLAWADRQAAEYACRHWHYSGCVPAGKCAIVGVWEFGKFVGVVVFGHGVNSTLVQRFGLTMFQGCELVRIAMRDHRSTVSRIVAIAIRMVRATMPGLRLVVSFADTDQNHHGGIYQAGGWTYTGLSQSADEYVVSGERIHGRSLRARRATSTHREMESLTWARTCLDADAYRVAGSRKHRYLLPLDDEMRKRIATLAQPYPKRTITNASATSVEPCDQQGTGGAAPTLTLQTTNAQT